MRHALRLTLALITLIAFATTLKAQSSNAADSLRATELAFARSVAEKNLEQFKAFLAQDAVFASGPTLRGPEAIADAWSYYFAPDAPPLLWCPTRVEVLDSGELGMTTGPYETLAKADNDGPRRVRGVFFSVWRRQSDGSWKIVFDSGTPPTAVAADTPARLDCSSDEGEFLPGRTSSLDGRRSRPDSAIQIGAGIVVEGDTAPDRAHDR